MRRWTRRWAIALLLLVMLPGAGEAARPAAIELRGQAGSLGQLVPVVLGDGSSYVLANRLAAVLKGAWRVKAGKGTLSVGSRRAEFTQNRARVVLLGASVALATAPRIGAGGWLIPEDFLVKGLAKLVPGVRSTRAVTVAAPATPARAAPPAVVASAPAPPTKPVRAAAFEELRFRSYPSFTRLVVESDSAMPYTVESGAEEIRLRLRGLALSGARAQEIGDGLVEQVTLEPAGGDAVLRVKLDSTAGQVKDFSLQDPFRVVVDIYRPKEPVAQDMARPAPPPLQLVVLDAGHGGHDPGATGPSGLTEKEVVLDVTKRVARMVEEGRLGVKVALTRSTDVFVPLRDRTNFANKQRADLFVSIHANAHPRSVSEGVETYFLSSEATDNEARQVAAIENGVVQLETPASRVRTDALKSILWDLAQSEFQQESSFLAETVQDSMTRSLRLVNRGVKQAGFYVLGGAAMPAILVEIGFLTNPKEEKKLGTPDHREAVAKAIYAGLVEYKRRYDQRTRTVLAPARNATTARP
ncbi:MAG TPA: N-acetylmuramoyl-L-alanine amidase [Candidatus Limnocylindrales bacterium]|nr:N-acetylmuramoyl-L-alanine amidase [Candidatus Limnocylindrales bacterium]